MKTTVFCYSLTGNNATLATALADAIGARMVQVRPLRRVTIPGQIAGVLLGSAPAVEPEPQLAPDCDMALLVGPVWMGMVAFPLRRHMAYLRKTKARYGFVSLCGGADGSNPGLAAELRKRVGREPSLLMNFHVRDLLPSLPTPTREVTSAYRLDESTARHLADVAAVKFRKLADAAPGSAVQAAPAQA